MYLVYRRHAGPSPGSGSKAQCNGSVHFLVIIVCLLLKLVLLLYWCHMFDIGTFIAITGNRVNFIFVMKFNMLLHVSSV